MRRCQQLILKSDRLGANFKHAWLLRSQDVKTSSVR